MDENETGQGMVEYILVLVLLSVVAIVVISTAGDDIADAARWIAGLVS